MSVVPNKVLKALPTGWQEEADAMTPEDLSKVIVDSTNNMKVAKEELEANPKYQKVKMQYDEVRGPFNDAMKCQKAKIAYALHLLGEKGKL